MGLLDFLDSRKSLAKWAATLFTAARENNPNISDAEIIKIAIKNRYDHGPSLSIRQKEILLENLPDAVDIHSLCAAIARAELLDHLDAADWKYGGIAHSSLAVISKELERLGFPEK